jgi:hypothetical protein
MNGSATTPNGDEIQGFPPLDAQPRDPNNARDLSPELAVFVIAIGPGKTVAGCEGAHYAPPSTASPAPLTGEAR